MTNPLASSAPPDPWSRRHGSAPATRERALRWVSTGVRLALAAVFVVAGAVKVTDPQSSVQAVRAYQLLPGWAERPVGWGLPFAEIALGLLLAAGVRTRAAAGVSAVVLAGFIAAVASAWARGLSIDCGCFGGGGEVAPGSARYGAEIARDLGFLALAGWLVVRPRSALSLDHLHDDAEEPGVPDQPDQPAQPDQLTDRAAAGVVGLADPDRSPRRGVPR